MQPTDILAANMFAAIASRLWRNEDGLRAGCFNHELLAAASFQADKPESCRVDAVPARGKKPVIPVNGGFDVPKRRRDRMARSRFDRHGASFLLDQDMIFKETGGILTDRVERPAQCSKRRAVNCMSMTHGHDLRMRFMHGCVKYKTCPIDSMFSLYDVALVVHQDQIGHFDQWTAIGLVQYNSPCSGSRTVRWPAKP